MAFISSLLKDDSKASRFSTQVGCSSINDALIDVAQEVARLLQQAYPLPASAINHAPPMTADFADAQAIPAIASES
jgi:hypothetical protein